jgi:16S rRNA (guanine1207-N2)-methyltransferase
VLSLPSQLLLRNAEHFEDGSWAFINPTESGVFEQIDNPKLIGLHQFYDAYTDCKKLESSRNQAQYFSASFSIADINGDLLDGIVIYLPKSKQQLSMLLDNAASLLKQDGVLLVVGENKSGIKSVSKMLEKYGNQVNKIDSAKHCGLYAVTVTEIQAAFDIDKLSIERTYCINDQDVKVVSLPGVFGHKQLDPATELLLNQYSKSDLSEMKGEFYDFACGTGIISAYFGLAANKYKNSIKISMSDVSALAIYCAKKTMQANDLSANIVAADGVIEHNKRFDIIVSNPPFHTGIHNDYSITESFIKRSFSCSVPYASISIVANKFLPYPNILDEVYGGFNEVCASNKYKVYRAIKTKK